MDSGVVMPGAEAFGEMPALPGYDVLGVLGEGGMGRVYRVRHRLMNQERVVKTIHTGLANTPEMKDRFLREIRIGAQLRHPGIVEVYDAWVQDGIGYLVMEYCKGRDLWLWYAQRPAATEAEVASLGRQIADALAFAHSNGVVHRDMKPQNVLMDEFGHVKIIDFGLARITRTNAEDDFETTNTVEGAIIGTPNCMSPEQIFDTRNVGPLSDLYGLGCVLFFCLTGRYPHEGRSVLEIARQITRPYTRLSVLRSGVSDLLEAIINRLLRQRPEERYPSAESARDALNALVMSFRRQSGGISSDVYAGIPTAATPTPAIEAAPQTRSQLLATMKLSAEEIQSGMEKRRESQRLKALSDRGASIPTRTPSGTVNNVDLVGGGPIMTDPLRNAMPFAGVTAMDGETWLPGTPRPDAGTRSIPKLRAYAPEHGWLEQEISGESMLVGRSTEADFCLPDGSVSRRHALVKLGRERSLEIRDAGSSYGLLVHGQRVSSAVLWSGESAQLGCFVVEYDDATSTPDPALGIWAHRGIRPLPSGMRAEWSAPRNPKPPESGWQPFPGGLLIHAMPEPAPGIQGKVLLTWPDGTRFVFGALAIEQVTTRKGRLVAVRLGSAPAN